MNHEYKQVIILRKDLKLSRGKAIVQGAHASIEAYDKADKAERADWKKDGAKKVVLQVETLDELIALYEDARQMELPASLIKDAGLTELPPGTVTAVAIGPAQAEKINKLTGDLPLLD